MLKFITENLDDLENETNLNSKENVCIIVQLIQITTSIIIHHRSYHKITSCIDDLLELLLEKTPMQNGKPYVVVNHSDIEIRKSAILAIVELKFVFTTPRLSKRINKHLAFGLNENQGQIIEIYLDKKRKTTTRPKTPTSHVTVKPAQTEIRAAKQKRLTEASMKQSEINSGSSQFLPIFDPPQLPTRSNPKTETLI